LPNQQIAPNLTQIAREFNFTDVEKDRKLGGDLAIGFFVVGGIVAIVVGCESLQTIDIAVTFCRRLH